VAGEASGDLHGAELLRELKARRPDLRIIGVGGPGKLDKHAAQFARDLSFDLGGARLKMNSLWVNVLKPGAAHTSHIHPHSVLSGTIYVRTPPGASALKLEDPRLAMMMAAPPRTADAPEDSRSFVYLQPEPGTILMWESWLRHEVEANAAKTPRISISFNYGWG
jgi:uncharacterized protein (TIGR02466 family)